MKHLEAALRSAALALLLCLLAVACGACGDDDELRPNPKECPPSPAVTAAVCKSEVQAKACYWTDEQAQLRTWCYCSSSLRWDCWEDPL